MFKKVSIRAFSAIMVLLASVLFPTFASGQNRMISGVVTDESGVSVIGAGVVVVGQRTIGTTYIPASIHNEAMLSGAWTSIAQ